MVETTRTSLCRRKHIPCHSRIITHTICNTCRMACNLHHVQSHSNNSHTHSNSNHHSLLHILHSKFLMATSQHTPCHMDVDTIPIHIPSIQLTRLANTSIRKKTHQHLYTSHLPRRITTISKGTTITHTITPILIRQTLGTRTLPTSLPTQYYTLSQTQQSSSSHHVIHIASFFIPNHCCTYLQHRLCTHMVVLDTCTAMVCFLGHLWCNLLSWSLLCLD
mmetsp:Transcript_6436/g.9355  ORF Transcript_6436/g.9355 Transcript_6436/m.9355 type:complete len:220 (+) Transcript_6436:472-1131(+)